MSTSFDTATRQKRWCVMVYLAADIELESAAMDDLEQMKAAGSSSEVDMLAQLNPGGARAIRRYHLQKDTYLQEDLVPGKDENGDEKLIYNVNAKQDLVDFVTWCVSVSEAEHYALILWGHGQGWKADNPDPCFVPGAGNPRKTLGEHFESIGIGNERVHFAPSLPISLPTTLFNEETGFLTNSDLREALAQAKAILGNTNIDILGMDACLMAMAEIGCQVYESVDYLVACEDTVPDESWPYDSILKLLVAYPQMTPEDFARVIVWKFIFDFGQKRKFVTQSICQLGNDGGGALNSFTEAMEGLVTALVSQLQDPETRWATMISRSQVQSFYMKDYVDVLDFCRLLSLNCKDKWVIRACNDVINSLRGRAVNGKSSPERLVIDYGTYGYPLKRSFGVSVYFPCVGDVPPCYPNLIFCQKTKWHEFLNLFLRSPQGHPAVFEAEPDVKPAPEIVPAEQPVTVAVGLLPAVTAAEGADNGAAFTREIAASGAFIASNMKLTYNPVKTTYGDVIKTSHGDPIKKPELPVWILPAGLNGKPEEPGTRTVRRAQQVSTVTRCGCGSKT